MEFYILYLKSLTHSCPRDSLFWMCSFLKLAGSSATYGMEHLFMARTTSHTSVFSLKNKTKQQTFYGKWVNKSIFLQLDCSRPTRDSSLTFYFISNPDVYFTSASTFFFFLLFRFPQAPSPQHSDKSLVQETNCSWISIGFSLMETYVHGHPKMMYW